MDVREQIGQRAEFRVVRGLPHAEADEQAAQRLGVAGQVRAECGIEVARRQPAEAALKPPSVQGVERRGARAELRFGPQRSVGGSPCVRVSVLRLEDVARGVLHVFVERLRIQHPDVGRADGQRQGMVEGVQKDEIAQHVPLHRQQKGVAAALQPLEQVGPAEAHQALARARQIRQHLRLGRSRRRVRGRPHVVAETVARELQAVHRGDHVVREQAGVLAVDGEAKRLGDPRREVRPAAVVERQIPAARGGVRGGIMVADETARPAHEVQAHEFLPVFRVRGLLERGQRAYRGLMPADELGLAEVAQQPFRADAQIFVLGHEQAQLAGQVRVRLVVRRGGQQDALAVVRPHVFLNGPIPLALAVAQIVALVDHDQAVAAQRGQLVRHARHRQDAGAQPIPVAVLLPHRHEVPRTQDQRLQIVVVLEHARQRGRHERLA